MQGSKLFEILAKLSPRRFKRFVDYMASPFFNKSEALLNFTMLISKYHPDLGHAKLSRESMIRKLQLNEKQLIYQMNQLIGHLDDYLVAEHLINNETLKGLELLDIYNSLDLGKQYKTVRDKLDRIAEQYPTRNTDYFELVYNISQRALEHHQKEQRVYNPNLQKLADDFDRYALAVKLRLSFEMANLQSMLNVEYRINHLEDMLDLAGEPGNRSYPVIDAYLTGILLLLNEGEDDSFNHLKALLQKRADHFSKDELKNFYTCLLNICTRRINQSNDEVAWQNYFSINEFLLEEGLLLDDGYLNPWRYTNLTAAALKTNRTTWALEFIRKNKKHLHENHRNDMYHYCMAQYYFHLDLFDQAQTEINKVAFADVYLNIAARSLMIKIYYESAEDDLLFSLLEATRIYLLRNKLIDETRKQQMQRFVELTQKLAKYEAFETEKLLALKKSMPKPFEILHHAWLTQKLKEKTGT